MTDILNAHFVDEHELALALARNALGMQLPVVELLEQLGIEPSHLIQLSKSESFTDMVKDYRKELEKDGEGIRLKSAVALEHSIKTLYTLIHNSDTPANVVVQGVKQLAEMAGVNKPQDAAVAAGSGFVVNIDLSGLTAQAPGARPATAPVRAAVVVDSIVSPRANTTTTEKE